MGEVLLLLTSNLTHSSPSMLLKRAILLRNLEAQYHCLNSADHCQVPTGVALRPLAAQVILLRLPLLCHPFLLRRCLLLHQCSHHKHMLVMLARVWVRVRCQKAKRPRTPLRP